jgi:hypothetical protein
VPETCWANNKICNKNSSVASSWHFISTYYRRCTVKTTSNLTFINGLLSTSKLFFYRKRHGTEIAYCILKILLTNARLLTCQPDVSRIKTSHFAVLLTSRPMVLKPFAFAHKSLIPPPEVNVIFNPIVRMKGMGYRIHPEFYSYTVVN